MEFLEKLRTKKVEEIKLRVKDPWIYKPEQSQPQQQVVYLKKESKTVEIIEKLKLEEEKAEEAAEVAAQVTTAAVGGAALATIGVGSLTGGLASQVVFVIKFFGILELLSNLAKINVNLGPKIMVVLKFTENIKIPEIGFLNKLSPFQDNDEEGKDVDAYQLNLRGSRGKITTSNRDVFIGSGQNFLFSVLILLAWIVKQILEYSLGGTNNKALNFVSGLYQLLIGLVFFDYQMICLTEISMFDYSRILETSSKFLVSLLISIFMMAQILGEYFQAFRIIELKQKEEKSKEKEIEKSEKKTDEAGGKENSDRESMKRFEKAFEEPSTENKQLEKKQRNFEEFEKTKILPYDELVFEKYTEGIDFENQKSTKGQRIILMESLRFFLIQIIISSLQLLNRTQALLVLIVDLIYFIHFAAVMKKGKVFSSVRIAVKAIIQEICLLIFIATMTLFSFTETTQFSKSVIYSLIEYITIASIVGAAGSELAILVRNMIEPLKDLCKGKKHNMTDEVKEKKTAKEEGEVNQRHKIFDREDDRVFDKARLRRDKLEVGINHVTKKNIKSKKNEDRWIDLEGRNHGVNGRLKFRWNRRGRNLKKFGQRKKAKNPIVGMDKNILL